MGVSKKALSQVRQGFVFLSDSLWLWGTYTGALLLTTAEVVTGATTKMYVP